MKLTPIGIWGGYPKANSATSSFLLKYEGFNCLIDCGSGVLSSLQNYLSLEQLDAVVLTHYHADHIADIGSLQYSRVIQYYLQESPKTLPIYGHSKDVEQFTKLSYKEQTIGIPIDEGQTIQIGPFTVTFCQTNHPVYCLAVKFSIQERSIIFTADTAWHEPLITFSKGADLLVSEANLYEEHIGVSPGHMGGSEAGRLANLAEVDQLLLTHLPLHGDVTNILKAAQTEFAGRAEIAVVGKTYEIPSLKSSN